MSDVEEWTAHWRDEHNVVHIMGTHTASRAYTECGVCVVKIARATHDWTNYYLAIRDPATCIACIAVNAEGVTLDRVAADLLRKKMDEPSFMSQLIRPVDDDE